MKVEWHLNDLRVPLKSVRHFTLLTNVEFHYRFRCVYVVVYRSVKKQVSAFIHFVVGKTL